MYTQKRDSVTKVAKHAVLAIVVLTVSEFWSLRRTPKFGRVSVVSGPSDNAAIPSGSSHRCSGGELVTPSVSPTTPALRGLPHTQISLEDCFQSVPRGTAKHLELCHLPATFRLAS